MDPLEYGNCSSDDLELFSEEISSDDLSFFNDRATAEKMVDKTVPASEHVTIDKNAELYSVVTKVEAGAQDVTVDADGLTIVIDGDIDSLTINGSGNTIWLNYTRTATFTRSGTNEGNFNYVFWQKEPPASENDATDTNVLAKAEHAPIVRLCSPFS